MDKLLKNYVPKKKWSAIHDIVKVNSKCYQITLNDGYVYTSKEGLVVKEFYAANTTDLWNMCKNIREFDLFDSLIDDFHGLQDWFKDEQEVLNAKKRKNRKKIEPNTDEAGTGSI